MFTRQFKTVLNSNGESLTLAVGMAALQKEKNKKEESKLQSTEPGVSECLVVSHLVDQVDKWESELPGYRKDGEGRGGYFL